MRTVTFDNSINEKQNIDHGGITTVYLLAAYIERKVST